MSDGAEKAVPTERKQRRRAGGRPFPKGVSGNPAGRPAGSRSATTVIAEQLLDGQAEGIVNKAIAMALDGDAAALRVCMDRIVSPRRDRPLVFKLPALDGLEAAGRAIAAIAEGVAAGDLTPSEAGELSRVVDGFVRVREAADLAGRVQALESRDDLATRLDTAIRRSKETEAKLAKPPPERPARSGKPLEF